MTTSRAAGDVPGNEPGHHHEQEHDQDRVRDLVALVLQAVDGRLTAVREQLIEVTNTVARNHAQLQGDIAACRELITAGTGQTAMNVDQRATADASNAASTQIVHAANELTERVAFLEARVNQYTDDRVGELRTMISGLATRTAGPTHSKLDDLPTWADDDPAHALTSSRGTHPSTALPPLPEPVVTLASLDMLAPLFAATPDDVSALAAAGVAGTGQLATPGDFDIDAFSAQVNARLAALVDGALAV